MGSGAIMMVRSHPGSGSVLGSPSNRLTTDDRMVMWNQGIDESCVLCQHQLKTRDQLFFRCTYSSSLWSRLMRQLMGTHYTEKWSNISLFISQSQLSQTQIFLRDTCSKPLSTCYGGNVTLGSMEKNYVQRRLSSGSLIDK